ncbi:hypothetical protein AB0L05_33100 [Nonomuraea pusilla]|uniref:hypothetical protein n=1 Tax=Nonomuraea pusilla TaxID=46177 RepID=UPI003329D942
MIVRAARPLLAGLLVVAAATACDSAGAAGGTGAVPTPRTAADLTLPFDAYDLSAEEREAVDKARFLMLAHCTRTFGVELKPVTAPAPIRRGRSADHVGWLGDLQVEKYGYAGPPQRLAVNYTGYTVSDEQHAVIAGRRRAFHGKAVPAGGCMGQVAELLNQGSLELLGGRAARVNEENDLEVLADEASEAASTDPRRREAERAWSACMRDVGFDYADTGAAVGDPRWANTAKDDQSPEPRGTTAEIATATADAACRLSTNYYGARQAAYRDSQQRIIAANQARLDRIKIINRTQLTNARRFLAGDLVMA